MKRPLLTALLLLASSAQAAPIDDGYAATWREFIFSFCKVGFVCWNGDPNWLGWILIVMGIVMGAFFLILIFAQILDAAGR